MRTGRRAERRAKTERRQQTAGPERMRPRVGASLPGTRPERLPPPCMPTTASQPPRPATTASQPASRPPTAPSRTLASPSALCLSRLEQSCGTLRSNTRQ
ncbi:hypothetical protein BC831DRAFT_440862 [Entophlyctis helioformis]|nr:hypothetical protein BC831DRAFT_440862 [Entophlyctis helioformis]